ncbi:MAG: DUF4126 domain-containing protein [Gammaproteobacteria bacterium]|nr:DUF4126 domain-containing protein [Gammaproteobacteria bacterium]
MCLFSRENHLDLPCGFEVLSDQGTIAHLGWAVVLVGSYSPFVINARVVIRFHCLLHDPAAYVHNQKGPRTNQSPTQDRIWTRKRSRQTSPRMEGRKRRPTACLPPRNVNHYRM